MDTLRKRDEKRRQEVLEAQQQPDVPKASKKNKAHLRPAEKIADARSKKDHGNTLFKVRCCVASSRGAHYSNNCVCF